MRDLHALDDVIDHAVAAVLAGDDVERVVRGVLRAHRTLDAHGRARVARRVHGVSCWRVKLAYLVEQAGDVVTPRALVDAYVRVVERGDDVTVAWPTDPVARLCVQGSLPQPWAELLWRTYGNDAFALMTSLNAPAAPVLRVNLARIDRAALHAQLEHEGIATHVGVHSSSALVVDNAPDTRANLFGCHAWREGLFEVQDEGSQLIVDACGAKPGDVVVDLCAGRGGKTLGLADHMHNRGLLYVHDVDERALADQAPRLARAHITCVQRGLPPTGTADVVLVDAPCSSTGTWRRSSDRRFRTHPNDVVGLVPLQRMLRMQGASLVKLGGTLVYATCSLVHDENEGIASEPLPGFTRVHTRVLLPHVDGTDGFFLAVWRRDDDDGSATDRKPARAHP